MVNTIEAIRALSRPPSTESAARIAAWVSRSREFSRLPAGTGLLNVCGDGDQKGGGWPLRPFALAGFGSSGIRPGGTAPALHQRHERAGYPRFACHPSLHGNRACHACAGLCMVPGAGRQ